MVDCSGTPRGPGAGRAGLWKWIVLCCALPVLGGCAAALVAGAVAGAGVVVYEKGKLEQTLPVSLDAAHSAGVAALGELKLPLIEDRHDAATAHLESEYADDKHVWIDMESVAEKSVKVVIRVSVMGDEQRSMDILGRIRKHAGVES